MTLIWRTLCLPKLNFYVWSDFAVISIHFQWHIYIYENNDFLHIVTGQIFGTVATFPWENNFNFVEMCCDSGVFWPF